VVHLVAFSVDHFGVVPVCDLLSEMVWSVTTPFMCICCYCWCIL